MTPILDLASVVLVDERDRPVGTMEKLEAHRQGILHRAFSVFLFNNRGETLLQQRAADKYHSALLWANACCSHPAPGEPVEARAQRRLVEELGVQATLLHQFTFTYRAQVGELVEHEYDHVFFGRWNGLVAPAPQEVASTRWVARQQLALELSTTPGRFVPWLHACWPKVAELWPA